MGGRDRDREREKEREKDWERSGNINRGTTVLENDISSRTNWKSVDAAGAGRT